MRVATSQFCPSAIQTAPGRSQAPGAGQGGILSALQFPVALPLSQKSKLHRLQFIAGRAFLALFKRFHRLVKQLAPRMLFRCQVPFAALVSRFHVLVALPMQRAHVFGHRASSLIFHDFRALASLARHRVETLAWGRVDLLCTQARGIGVNGLPALVAPVDLSAGGSAGHGDQCGGETSLHASSPSNVGAWLSIADFLTRQNLRAVLAERAAAGGQAGKRSAAVPPAAAREACAPHGNHGENDK